MTRTQVTVMLVFLLLLLVSVSVLLGFIYQQQYGPVSATKPSIPGRSTLGVHTLVGQEEGRADIIAQTRQLMTEVHGSSFIAFSAGYASNADGPIDTKGNQWQMFGDPVIYRGYNGAFDVKAYLVVNGHGGPHHQVRIEKQGNPKGELTMPVVEVRNAKRLVDVAYNYPKSGDTLTSGTVETDGPAFLVAFWWGDGPGLRHRALPDNGFEIIENFTLLPPGSAVQCVVAVREVDHAGSYSVTWSTSPEQGAPLWLFAFGP